MLRMSNTESLTPPGSGPLGLCVVQAATDIFEASKEAIETEVTSEIEGTLKCRSKNRDPYMQGGLCAHGLCTPILYVCVSVIVILIQLLVGNQIEHCTDRSADINTAIVSIITMKNNRISIRRTKTIKISKNSLFP